MSDRQAFWAAYLERGLSEPLTACEIAGLFGIGRNKTTAMLSRMGGVERLDSFYRLPLSKMPPVYFVRRGLICSDLHNPSE